MFKNYIFDLDGTIINSSKEVLICFEKAFEKANYIIDKSRLTPNVIGPPLRDIIKLIAPEIKENKIDEIEKIFHEIYDNDLNDISEIYTGMYELLNEIKLKGHNLFMATYKPTSPTERIIKQFHLDMFDDIYTIDKFGKHITKTDMINDIVQKYNLNKSETVMIGDAASDVISAKEAKVTAIGVLWGYGEEKTGLINNSDIIVKSINELVDCFEGAING